MSGSAATIPKLFAVEAAKGTPTATGPRSCGPPTTPPKCPLQRTPNYGGTTPSATALRLGAKPRCTRFGLATTPYSLPRAEVGVLTAPRRANRRCAPPCSCSGEEPYASTPDQTFVQAARKTILETIHALGVASRVTDLCAERRTLRAGTAAAARAFVAAYGFIGAAPEEARAAVSAMRDVSAAIH
jgi:hypothetical protein